MAFDSLIKFRCERELQARVLRLSKHPSNRGRDFADLCRIAMEDYCAAEEERLRLKPISSVEIIEYLAVLEGERRLALNEKPAPYGRNVPTTDTHHKSKRGPKAGPSN